MLEMLSKHNTQGLSWRHNSTAQHSTAQHSTVHITASSLSQYSSANGSGLHHAQFCLSRCTASTGQHSTAHSPAQHTAQHSTQSSTTPSPHLYGPLATTIVLPIKLSSLRVRCTPEEPNWGAPPLKPPAPIPPIPRKGVPLSNGRGEAIVMGLVKAFLAGVAQGAGDLKPAEQG